MKTTVLNGTLCLLATSFFLTNSTFASTQTDIPGPAGSEMFGTTVTVLPNGNFVVTDPSYDAPGIQAAGRVYLYNGSTLALINTMTGTAPFDAVGSNFTSNPVTVLPNGDYLVCSSEWNFGRGAVTRCSGTTGCPSTINSSNSLVGGPLNDEVGRDGIVVLPNGNFVVRSSQWNNSTITFQAGALTWFPAAATPTGTVTTANSRYGGHQGDQIGLNGVVVLSNNNYVTLDTRWNNGAGASTFCSGTAACTGVVSSANSLVGTSAGDFNQIVITPLTNGNYVVNNGLWDNGSAADVGAATFCDGNVGCHAVVGPANSLIGTTGAGQGQGDFVGLDGSIALTNGNYVVESSAWNRPGAAGAGAATFCNGTTGCVNMTVSSANSLVGVTTDDNVGKGTALTNGKYVINSPFWHNPTGTPSTANWGASTFCGSISGCTGDVTTANSLTGHRSGDVVGGSAVALTNGNYVVSSLGWTNDNGFFATGAVTWCNGSTGCSGTVTDANSLIGAHANDQVGNVTALTNGNYVVSSLFWDNGNVIDAGSATFCNGASGCIGTVSPLNSLVGTKAGEGVGQTIYTLPNGNYVAQSISWDNGGAQAGAVTFCSGTAGRVGAVTASNSLIGSNGSDGVGMFFPGGVFPLANSDYIVYSPMWANGATPKAGAVSYALANGGTVGPITAANSVRGMITSNMGGSMRFSTGSSGTDLVVGRPLENIVSVFRQGGIAFSAVSRKTQGAGTFDINLPPAGSPGVECRSGGGTNDYKVVFTFPVSVTFAGASVASGVGIVSSSSGGGTNTVTVNLTGVTNAQTITVTLTNVNNGTTSGDVSVPMGVLIGDTTGNGSVNASDVTQTKLRAGQTIDVTNFRTDVTGNGVINASDVSSVKTRAGSSLP